MHPDDKSGIRAEVRIKSPNDCPIAEISGKNNASSRSISKAASIDSPLITEEVMFDSRCEVDELDTGDEVEEVFSYGSNDVYRFTRQEGRGCACECIEEFGCPLIETYTRGGNLYLTFHTPDIDTLKEVVNRLDDQYTDVDIERLIRSKKDMQSHHLVFVDRGELTDRQEEVLRKAHEMGYFEHPKSANAGEVAEELGISTSTFTEHLAAAQRKLMKAILST